MSYHAFRDEEGNEYGSFEVFRVNGNFSLPPGWYWWACCPGCMPDGEAMGPFASHEEAINDARSVQKMYLSYISAVTRSDREVMEWLIRFAPALKVAVRADVAAVQVILQRASRQAKRVPKKGKQ